MKVYVVVVAIIAIVMVQCGMVLALGRNGIRFRFRPRELAPVGKCVRTDEAVGIEFRGLTDKSETLPLLSAGFTCAGVDHFHCHQRGTLSTKAGDYWFSFKETEMVQGCMDQRGACSQAPPVLLSYIANRTDPSPLFTTVPMRWWYDDVGFFNPADFTVGGYTSFGYRFDMVTV